MADSDFLESSESFTSSDSISSLSSPDLDNAVVDDTPRETVSATSEVVDNKQKSSGGLFSDFNIFNAMLMASLLLILLATFFVFMELTDYGGLDGSWRTGSVGR